MRSVVCILLLLGLSFPGRATVLINEVQPSNQATLVLPDGTTPDWVEVINTGRSAVDLLGMRLVLGARQHVIDAPLVIPAGQRRLLYCSGKPANGPDHLVFRLPRSGGTLMLIAANGFDVLDVFSWPAMPPGVSMGRQPDGAAAWSLFDLPTPGARNATASTLRGITSAPVADVGGGHHAVPFTLSLTAEEGTQIHFTLDGSAPTEQDPVWAAPLMISERAVLRARAWKSDRLPGPELCATYIIGESPGPIATLVMDPLDLDGDSGIYYPGAQANHTRSGLAWERRGMIDLPGMEAPVPVGVRIHGSGSRGLAKRSFKLHARSRYESPAQGLPQLDGAAFHEAILRADASPHAFLRNLLLEELVLHHGLHVDVQPSTPMPLYLNGRPWGLYRLMPPKDAEWLRSVSGAEALDVLTGPSLRALNGSDAHFRQALAMLYRRAPMDSIEEVMDLSSLIDLACLDLWTGRADHDLNVRLYRPRQPGGRWRWILFDMDVWAPVHDHSVARMASAVTPEAPWLPRLLGHPQIALRLLARITAMQAAVLTPQVAGAAADRIHRQYLPLLQADHRRWDLELDMATPEASLSEVQGFITGRPAHLMRHLADHADRSLRTIAVEAPGAGTGTLRMEGLALPAGRHNVRCLTGVPVLLEAEPAPGHEFAGWKGVDDDSPRIRVDLARCKQVRPLFRPVVP